MFALSTGFGASLRAWRQIARRAIFSRVACDALIAALTLAPAAGLAQQPEIVVQSGHASPVNTVSFSPDGKLLASGTGDEWSLVEKNVVKIWEVATGRELRTLVQPWPVKWGGFSPDGKKLAVKGGAIVEQCRVWDVTSGAALPDEKGGPEYAQRERTEKIIAAIDGKNIVLRDALGGTLRTLASRTADFQKYLFSPDSSILACGGERYSIRLWDLKAGVLRTLVGHTDFPVVADFSPDSRLFASGGRDLIVRIWDVTAGQEIKTCEGHTGVNIRGMQFSASGKTLLSYDKLGFKLWDIATGRELISALGSHDEAFDRVVFSPKGDRLAAMVDSDIKLWEADTGRELMTFRASSGALAFSPDGSLLLAHDISRIKLWDVKSGKQLASIERSVQAEPFEVMFERVAISPNSRILAISEADSRDATQTWRLFLHDTKTGKRLQAIEDKSIDSSGLLVFTPDSKRISTESSDRVANWDVATGKRLVDSRPPIHYSNSPNGVYRVALQASGEIELMDGRTGQSLASLIGIGETDWLVVTAEGFFDGSPAAWKQILWRFNNDTFNYAPLEAFFNDFFHPGLLQDVLVGKRPKRPDGKSLSRIDRRPPLVSVVELDPPADGSQPRSGRMARLAIDVAESAATPAQADHPPGSGARDIRLFRNGSLIKVWRGDALTSATNAHNPLRSPESKGRQVRYEISVPIVAGPNEFTAYAFNAANVKSADAELSVVGGENLRRRPTLHVLSIGIDQYQSPQFNLRFAVADAREFATEVARQQKALQNFERVETTLLVDAEATKRNILAAIADLVRKAQAEDAIIVYFAGHGIAHQDQFYLVPHDLGLNGDQTRTRQGGIDWLLHHGVSDRELERAFERVDAAHFLLVVDACNSGQALEAEEKRRGPMNSKGLAQLAYEKGISVLTASQSFQAAREVSKVGHGLLTYVLVHEGLKQAAADSAPHDRQILLPEWLDYAARRVPQVQVRDLARTRGANPGALVSEPQRPRLFYRADNTAGPLVMAHVSQTQTPHNAVLDEATVPAAELKPLALAVSDRTLTDQPISRALAAKWRGRIDAMARTHGKIVTRVEDPAAADWILHVAAPQRTDVVYLVPSKKLVEHPDDAMLRMSPCGDKAIGWLQAELEQIHVHGRAALTSIAETGETTDRAILGLARKGPAEDLKAEIVQEQSGIYHTPNRTQAVLGTYGKMIDRNRLLGHLRRFEHRGLMQHMEQVRRFTTVQRQGSGSGKDFVSLVGTRQAWQVVDLTGSVSGGRQNEVTFEIVGLRLDQNDAIKAINADLDALNYFDYLAKNNEVPCVILENLVFTSYTAGQSTNLALGAKAKTALTSDGGAASLQTQRSSFTQFTSPIVRGYQMYQVKLNQNRVVELVNVEP